MQFLEMTVGLSSIAYIAESTNLHHLFQNVPKLVTRKNRVIISNTKHSVMSITNANILHYIYALVLEINNGTLIPVHVIMQKMFGTSAIILQKDI